MSLAPIAFFTYNRPAHTQRALESLSHNKGASESELYIFCDAPKREKDREAVEQVRAVVQSYSWCGSVHIIEQPINQGCANSIIQGVTKLCHEYGKVIVVEDDLILSPFFLNYMNRALDTYVNASSVMQISGHMFPVQLKAKNDAIFLSFTTSWGWATWQRAWKHFDPEMTGYEILRKNRKLRHHFNLNGAYPYFSMLEAQRNGQIDSWAIRWYLSVFMHKGLTLYPVRSLVDNLGFDGSGTHCGIRSDRIANFSNQSFGLNSTFPNSLSLSKESTEIIYKYFFSLTSRRTLKDNFFELLKLLRIKIKLWLGNIA